MFRIITMLLMFTVPSVWCNCVHCMDNIVIWLKGSFLAYNNNKINVKLEEKKRLWLFVFLGYNYLLNNKTILYD